MIRSVLFDAVGTLIRPAPSAAAVYAAAGQRHGSPLDEATVAARFRRAFARQEALDRQPGGDRTSEERERSRWQTIVAEVFPGVGDSQALFDELWRHFARPASWAVFDDVPPAWQSLAAAGLTMGVASNFDARVLSIGQTIEPLAGCRHVFISSLLTWRKPSPRFFAAIEAELRLPPEQLLLVGDDLANDYDAARSAGWHAILLDRLGGADDRQTSVPRADRIATLAELPGRLLGVRSA